MTEDSRPPPGRRRVILHVDADAFFCQVERRRDPRLAGCPALAVQQHQDVIAADAAAKKAGVTKRMTPADARALLRRVGGTLVHVHTVAGQRVSYRPYLAASSELYDIIIDHIADINLLNTLASDSFEDKGVATRIHSQTMLNALGSAIPGFVGGSADLAPSNMTLMKQFGDFQKDTPAERNIRYGVREHGMGAIANAIAIAIRIKGVGAIGHFIAIGDTIIVGIRIEGLTLTDGTKGGAHPCSNSVRFYIFLASHIMW